MSELSESDRKLLAGAPAAVLLLVAGADGKVDRAERRRFEKMLSADHSVGSEVISGILQLAAKEGQATFEEAGGDAELYLQRVRGVAEASLSEEDCLALKKGLWMMGDALAHSSGGGLFGVGKRVDETENLALRRLRELLVV